MNSQLTLGHGVDSDRIILATAAANQTYEAQLTILKGVFDDLTDEQKERCYIMRSGGAIYGLVSKNGIFSTSSINNNNNRINMTTYRINSTSILAYSAVVTPKTNSTIGSYADVTFTDLAGSNDADEMYLCYV